MKKTYAELKKFVGLASAFLHTHPAETPLHYALRRTLSRCESAVKTIEEDIADQKLALASVDEKKNLTFDGRGNYTFSRENYQELTKFLRELDSREIEVEPFAVKAEKIPAGIQGIFRESFEDFGVLPVLAEGQTPVITDEDLLGKSLALCHAVEKLPASEQQTEISLRASEVHGLLTVRFQK